MGGDIIDFTMLHKKGILQRAMQKSEIDNVNSRNEGSVVDFTRTSSSAVDSASALPSALPDISNPLAGFFGGDSSGGSAASADFAVKLDISSLKFKLEDAEYKLERALERIDALERKIVSISQVKS